jgi:undecaprenyl diphosphate synthase
MVDWAKILSIRKPRIFINKINTPKHVGITTEGVKKWAENNNKTLEESYKKQFYIINKLIRLQVDFDIPILTINLEESKSLVGNKKLTNCIKRFFYKLSKNDLLHKNQVKISILGKWYDLPGEVIEPIRFAIDETKDYDKYFLNFCINYDGHEELIDSCKILIRQIENKKIHIDEINQQTIKDNLYTSYFLPLDLVIRSGHKHELSDFLMWDSTNAIIYFTNKNWPDFNEDDFLNAIAKYQRN